MSQLLVDDIVDKDGGNSVGFSKGINVSASSTITGNLNVTGVLTYEDVTNVDSVGVITARSGIKLGAAGVGGTIRANGDTTLAGVVTATSFSGDGSALTGLANTDFINATQLNVIGVTTVGSAVTINSTGIDAVSGVITASSFKATSSPTITIRDGATEKGYIGFNGNDPFIGRKDGVGLSFQNNKVRPVDGDDGSPSNNTVDIGEPTYKFKDLYLAGNANIAGAASTFSGNLNVGSAVTVYGSSGIVSATSYYGDASNMSGMAGGAWEVVSTTALSGSTSDLQLYGWSNNYAQYKVVFQDCYNSSDIKMRIRFYTDATSGNNGTLVTSGNYAYVGGYINWNNTSGPNMEAGNNDYFYPYTTASGGSAEIYTGELIFPMKTSGYNDAVKCYGTMMAHAAYWPFISCELNDNTTHFLTGIHIYFIESGNTNPLSPTTGRITLLRMKYS